MEFGFSGCRFGMGKNAWVYAPTLQMIYATLAYFTSKIKDESLMSHHNEHGKMALYVQKILNINLFILGCSMLVNFLIALKIVRFEFNYLLHNKFIVFL